MLYAEGLNQSASLPTTLENVVTIDREKITEYAGSLFDLKFENGDLLGYALLERYDFVMHKGLFDKQSMSKRKRVWSFGLHTQYFITKNREISASYRKALIHAAGKKGILLGDELLSAVFDPLDKQIMEFYKVTQ